MFFYGLDLRSNIRAEKQKAGKLQENDVI